MESIKELYEKLNEDKWRREHPFSTDMQEIHGIVFHPFRSDAQREEAYLIWLKTKQPCLFGRIAAAKQRIHFCFLGEQDFLKTDEEIAEQIQSDRLAWKQRSVWPHKDFTNPAHGFILIAFSPRLAFAAPNDNLRRFAERLLSLWGIPASDGPSGLVHSETLYLRHPTEAHYTQFRFSVDFFMAQGDGRWWQDHRVPGGLAFTANSAGHMRRYREWYEGLSGQQEWVLQTAMLTINEAQDTPYGKATWLRPLMNDQPMVNGLKCPFADAEKLKPELKGKDWTRYGGHLHTDQCIRDEFFFDEAEKVAEVVGKQYVQDFTYLYDPREADHVWFIQGQNVAENSVFAEIGDPQAYVKITTIRPKKRADAFVADEDEKVRGMAEVEEKLDGIRFWASNDPPQD